MGRVNDNTANRAPVTAILRAVAFAAHKHRNQRRKDEVASPYINHPIALAELLASVGLEQDTEVLIAALLHDTVEDTDTTFEELEAKFGTPIAAFFTRFGMVVQITTSPGLQRALPTSVLSRLLTG